MRTFNIHGMKMAVRMTLAWILGIAAIGLLGTLPGCHSRKSKSGVESGAVNSEPKIVSTVPAATEILLQLGAGSRLAAVSTYDRPLLPPRLKNLPVIGNYMRLNTELMLTLHPTSLILQINPKLIPAGVREVCNQVHCRIIDIKLNSEQELERTTVRLGRAAKCTRRAMAVAERLNREFKSADLNAKKLTPVPVVYLLSTAPLRIVGSGNFMNDELKLAGGRNLGCVFGDGFPKITHAELRQLHPQKVLIWHPDAIYHHAYHWLARIYGARLCCITWRDADLLSLNVIARIHAIQRLIHDTGPTVTAGQLMEGQPH
jgi:ABC-type hemin transport system substrate-binding protein